MQEFNTLYLTRFRAYKIARPPHTKIQEKGPQTDKHVFKKSLCIAGKLFQMTTFCFGVNIVYQSMGLANIFAAKLIRQPCQVDWLDQTFYMLSQAVILSGPSSPRYADLNSSSMYFGYTVGSSVIVTFFYIQYSISHILNLNK